MSYNPTTWSTGDIVTAYRLNKIEQGLKNKDIIFHVTLTWDSSYRVMKTDKTAAQIKAASDDGKAIVVTSQDWKYSVLSNYGVDIAGSSSAVMCVEPEEPEQGNDLFIMFIFLEKDRSFQGSSTSWTDPVSFAYNG